MDKRCLEDCLAKGMSLPEIGRLVGKPAGTVGYWVKRHSLKANGADKYSPRGGVDWELLEILVDEGLTVREIAAELSLSPSMVRRGMERYGFQPTGGDRRRAARKAREAGLKEAELECPHHGFTAHVLQNRGSYKCKKCRAEAVVRRRRKVKEILVSEAGGKCQICGYDRCIAALEFHHVDPSTKSFGISRRGVTRGIDEVRMEAKKCVLLCAICHVEVETGSAELPVKLEVPATDTK
jgi:hypothetical protein